ncbi:WcbI family polysaccharide biosynthesis putative acetyltransferase [Desulfovibrio sp. ZJ200]|uniref:WcbI family polysaccharide biosynthesis putative acetyltransferase n=1 Tax=Desulfovibrio sp. ZJ200 TaxID=2709792 RepID=UPI0013EDCA60|nr:WcbI family polysaccharide biosynthesis putative acetyltransferase [Desulfovibrio sp. ZJ200]
MPSALCLLHANCQGDALRPLLENSPAFSRFFRIRQYVNYTRQSIAEADLKQCALFLYQRLAPRWGALSTEQLLPRLSPSCQVVEIPNLFFKGYWPFWTNAIKAVNFADSLLERLLAQGLAPEEVLHLYLRGDPALLGDVAAVAEDSLTREEAKEAHAPIRCASLLRERWRDEQLFITVNHPGKTLLFHVADCLLRLLGLGRLPEDARRTYVHPQEDFWLPIHPALGPLLGLPFAARERRYPVFAARLTHREYTSCYLACRRHGVTDLLSLLRTLSPCGKMCAA